MTRPPRRPFATRVYERLMGVKTARLVRGHAQPGLASVLYYAYVRGFWPLIRGTLLRPRLGSSGGRLFVGSHARILFPSRLRTGRNVAIGDFAYLSCYGRHGITIGNDVRIREFVWIQVTSHLTAPGEGLTIGDETYIAPHAVIGAAAGVEIGRSVAIGHYSQILAEDHVFADVTRPIGEQGVTRRGIRIGDDCWIGNSVIVLDGVTIGAGAVIGAGSVVTRDIPERAVAVGNPARVIRERGEG